MKLGVVAAPAFRGPVVRLGVVDLTPQATLNVAITAERRARLERAACGSDRDFRRALRAVLRGVA